ncbi:unnamed protein product [Moneuplotes crassus]|uniref:Autophagy-related protein n=1 Tax=Euplotes crassus TaxID=5936 RepID=A0AAD1Y540_EUPCR|nr:unnamed protein product [Moneuplotes crassus]
MEDYKSGPLATRKAASKKATDKFPSKIPIICQKSTSSVLPSLAKSKFLIPKSLEVLEFERLIRKRISLDEREAIFFLINGKIMPRKDSTMEQVYEKEKDEDGFLYVIYTEENFIG